MGAMAAVLNKKSEDATETVVTMLKILTHKNAETFALASPSTIQIKNTINDFQRQSIKSHIIIGYAFSKIQIDDKPQLVELRNATLVFDGRIYSQKKKMLFAKSSVEKFSPHETMVKIIRKEEGDFVIAIAEAGRIIAGRDPIGIRPLYFGQNANFAALASEQKALWKIGIEKTSSFPPGHIAFVDEKDIRFQPARAFAYQKPKQISIRAAAKELQRLLQRSIRDRSLGLKEVAVAFSGGLDSSIIGFMAKELKVNVQLIHVSLENQPETKHAKEMAEKLALPIHVYEFKEEDVERVLPQVLWLVEKTDPLRISISVPMYWIAEKASKMGFRVMLAGQGADELFGGYKRYVDKYIEHGSETTRKMIFDDIARNHEANFERDYKICNFHNLELRLPFATLEITKFAITLPLDLAVEPQQNSLRKLVLRQTAKNLQLPEAITKKPKKAIQYATGTDKSLKKSAKKQGLTIKDYLQKRLRETIEKMM